MPGTGDSHCCDLARALLPLSQLPQPGTSETILPVNQFPEHRYMAFGLEIASDLAMPELASGGHREPDLVIETGRVAGDAVSADRPVMFCFREDDGGDADTMAWHDVARFRISGADRITYEGAPQSGDALVSLPLLGPVMAVLLHRRGLLTLHGSAVVIDGRASVFLGDTGAGKSTTAAALVRAGYGLVTDDIVAVDPGAGGGPIIWPGYPQVKLTDIATDALPLAGAETMPSPHPDFGKHRHLLSGPFSSEAVGLSEAVVLQRGERLEIQPLRGMEAVQALLRFSYIVRFGDRILKGRAQARHLSQCVAVTRATTVCRMIVPHDLATLSDVAEALRDFRQDQARAAT